MSDFDSTIKMGLQSFIMSMLYFVYISMQAHRSLFGREPPQQRVIACFKKSIKIEKVATLPDS